ncbi:MAG: trypsin-like peptidase domain-containing protein [Silvibacterium sp.]
MRATVTALTSMALSLAACLSTASFAQNIENIEGAKKAVVKITSQAEGENRVGTGFIAKLDENTAYIVTASHVIEGDSKPQICFYPDAEKTYPATVIGTEGDLPRGLALIRVQGPLPSGLAHLGIDASFNLEASEQVTIIGFPRLAGTPWAVTPITIVGRQGTAITFTGAADEGSSGSPVLRHGWVTALVAEKSGEFGFAVPAAAVRFAIEGWGLKLLPDEAGSGSTHAPLTRPDARLANTRILFMSERDSNLTGNNSDLYTMDANGKNTKRVSPAHVIDAHDAGWSRDGNSITYVVDEDVKTMGIYQTEIGSGKTTKLTKDMAYFAIPVWSPDGERIAFLANTGVDSDDKDVFTMARNGTNLTRLTRKPSRKVSLFWSPGGNKIGFAEESTGGYKTFLMNVDGTEQQQLSSPLTDFGGAAWSANGSKIIGESMHDGYPAIYTVNDDGSDPVRLTNDPEGDGSPDWSPDGTRIIFTSFRDGHAEIYEMNSDGSNQVRLTSGTAPSSSPQWSPFPQ